MQNFSEIVAGLQLMSVGRAILMLTIGYFVSRFISGSLNGRLSKKLSIHQVTLLRRIIFYVIFLLFFASAIQQLGFQINALLGATGIFTVAIGIAAQTSMSNLISGLFIIGEKPFEIGNTIKVNGVQGEVLSIDFLSVKIRTNDNLMIRIPNETLIKSAITNVSYFPLRRIDLFFAINAEENLKKLETLLIGIAHQNEFCLKEPSPNLTVESIGDGMINLQFSTWVKQESYSKAKNELQAAIANQFTQQDIKTWSNPFTSNLAEPFPVKIIESRPER